MLKRVVWCVAMSFNMIAVRGIERIRHPYTVWIGLKVTRRSAVAAQIPSASTINYSSSYVTGYNAPWVCIVRCYNAMRCVVCAMDAQSYALWCRRCSSRDDPAGRLYISAAMQCGVEPPGSRFSVLR